MRENLKKYSFLLYFLNKEASFYCNSDITIIGCSFLGWKPSHKQKMLKRASVPIRSMKEFFSSVNLHK
jgi:hypothetical protein